MALQNTNLIIQAAPLPVTFKGTPQEWLEEFLRRLKIVSPSGTNFIYVGDIEPVNNSGPWLKNGTQWWVWDEDIKRYIPLDISASETTWFHMGNSTPGSIDPPVWLKTENDGPAFGNPISWYTYNGTAWVCYNSIVAAGTTAQRPSNPQALQQYYDTTIGCLIWYERAAWRTVDGVPGDIKAVAFEYLEDALEANPGWSLLGASNQSWRGRYLIQASKDAPGGPADESVSAGIAQRMAHEVFGETQGIRASSDLLISYPPTIAMWHLIKD